MKNTAGFSISKAIRSVAFASGKLAITLACLAVAAIFASCNKPNNEDTPPPVDTKLVGVWGLSASGFTTNIEFKSDGTYYSVAFRYSSGTYYATHMRGNFSVKDGIYTLINLEVRNGKRTEKPGNMELLWTWTDEWHSSSTPAQVYYYAIGTDEDGKYMVRNQDTPLTEDNYNAKWRIVQ